MSILLVLLVVVLIGGAAPVWSYNRTWGPAPIGIMGVVLLVLLVLYMTGHRL